MPSRVLRQLFSIIGAQRGWAQLTQFFDEGIKFMHQFGRFGRRDPARLEPLFFDSAELEHFLQNGDALLGGIITIQVIAFTQVSAADEHPVDSPLKSEQNMMRRHAPTTHYPNGTNIRRVL